MWLLASMASGSYTKSAERGHVAIWYQEGAGCNQARAAFSCMESFYAGQHMI